MFMSSCSMPSFMGHSTRAAPAPTSQSLPSACACLMLVPVITVNPQIYIYPEGRVRMLLRCGYHTVGPTSSVPSIRGLGSLFPKSSAKT